MQPILEYARKVKGQDSSRGERTDLPSLAPDYTLTAVKVGRNAPELSSWVPQNRHPAFLGPKFTKFFPELWSLAAGTLFRGLES